MRETIGFRAAIILIGVSWSIAAVAVPATKPAPPDSKAQAAVSNAVLELLKEAHALYAAKPDAAAKPREKSDYFPPDLPDGVTPAAILTALERPIDRDPRVEAYVKWQLLSAMPPQLPPELVQRVLNLYRRAPEPFDHPGLNHTKLTQVVFRVGVMNKDAVAKIKEEFDPVVAAIAAQNEPILHYRSELFSRLPPGAEVYYTVFQDVGVRVRHGSPSGPMWDQVNASVKTWAETASPDPRQLNALIKALNDLMALDRNDRNQPFVNIEYREQGNPAGLTWVPQQVVPDGSIQALIDALKDAAKSGSGAGGGGLNFKDDKKK